MIKETFMTEKNKLTIFTFIALLLLPLLSVYIPQTYAEDHPANSIYVSPEMVNATELGLGLNDTFDIYVYINVTGLYGFEYKLQWDDTLIKLKHLDIQLPWSPNFIAKNDTSTPGQYWIGASALAPAPAYNGSTWVTHLVFQVAHQPAYPEPDMNCTLHITGDKLSDKSATPIPHTVYDGKYWIGTSMPSTKPTLKLSPTGYPQTVTANDTFTVNITISNLDPLWRMQVWEILLNYNATMLNLVNVTEGSFLKSFQGPNGTFFLFKNFPDKNYVDLGNLFLGTPAQWPSGAGVLATLTFNATTSGNYSFYIQEVKLTNQQASWIPSYIFEDHIIPCAGTNYHIYTLSDAAVTPIKFYLDYRAISFVVSGRSGITAFCNITIPKELLSDQWLVLIDGVETTYTMTENATYTTLTLTYTFQSEHTIYIFGTSVIPEFPTSMLLLILASVTLVAVAIKRRRICPPLIR